MRFEKLLDNCPNWLKYIIKIMSAGILLIIVLGVCIIKVIEKLLRLVIVGFLYILKGIGWIVTIVLLPVLLTTFLVIKKEIIYGIHLLEYAVENIFKGFGMK